MASENEMTHRVFCNSAFIREHTYFTVFSIVLYLLFIDLSKSVIDSNLQSS